MQTREIMSITLYTAPNCIRCQIIKNYLADNNISYNTIDFKNDKEVFTTFYRAYRSEIYRNSEGVEFPLFYDEKNVRQGSGIILSYLLAGHDMDASVTRSDLLHGWISGLYPSLCPQKHNDDFLTITKYLAKGGLKVFLQPDGRNPELLERLITSGTIEKVTLTILGEKDVYGSNKSSLKEDELAKSITLVTAHPQGTIRILVSPVKRSDGQWSWSTKEETVEAALMIATAAKAPTLPVEIGCVTEHMPQGLHGLEPLPKEALLQYRSACRKYLFKADVAKD